MRNGEFSSNFDPSYVLSIRSTTQDHSFDAVFTRRDKKRTWPFYPYIPIDVTVRIAEDDVFFSSRRLWLWVWDG